MTEKNISKKRKSDFDKFIEELQSDITAEERAIYSAKVIEEYNNPKNVGRLQRPDGEAILTGPCGDTMEFYLKIEDGNINEISFMTDGCGPTIACGSKLISMVKNLSFEEARKITNTILIEALDGLPEESLHCAKLAVDTFQAALADYDKRHEKSL